MWMLDNRTPYQAERTWVRDKEGAHDWIVVVKATYDIAEDGGLTLSEAPVVPLHEPEYRGVPGASSVKYEADLTPMKPGTDVYLNAIAYAPRGRACTEVMVSLRVGRLSKELMVYGERIWEKTWTGGATLSSPRPFETVPIIYERAFGGFDNLDPDPRRHSIDFRNPSGIGLACRKSHLFGRPAPSIEYPGRKLGDGWPPGFGAVASFWSPRKELAGTYDDRWMLERRPLLPEDYEPRCLLCAPLDQQPEGYLCGGEEVELVNLTPRGRLLLILPNVSLRFGTFFGSLQKVHRAELVSMIIDSEGPRLILVWQTRLACGNDVDYLDKTVITESGHE